MRTAIYTDAAGETLCYSCVTEKKNRTRLLGLRFNVDQPSLCCEVCHRFIPMEWDGQDESNHDAAA